MTHSFPTRRSSDLQQMPMKQMGMSQSSNSDSTAQSAEGTGAIDALDTQSGTVKLSHGPIKSLNWPAMTMSFPVAERKLLQGLKRSEEHTSELQSLMRISYAVFCLKKKNTHN